MKRIIILGAGGNSRDMIDTLLDINDAANGPVYEPVGYLDDDPAKLGSQLGGFPVLGPLSAAASYPDCYFINSINGTRLMSRKAGIIAAAGGPLGRFETIVHPTASVSRMAHLGRGTVIFQHVSICSNVRVGNHVAVLPNTVIAHDCVIGDHCYLTPSVSLAGYVEIGAAAYLGNNCSVMCRVKIGPRAIVGMGSVVLEDVPEGWTVAGAPARRIGTSPHRS